ncbi:hypothetical protein Baya_8997 [Bagarius yarrelli]|uniref:Uncharacterized protein n=1 Tax=Bagarius yarrelli TaxID=175774 RepID=A0A556U7U2_BAGYA|nr:hypothetical protein Baya_8997 [Bagarius yarrelli]
MPHGWLGIVCHSAARRGCIKVQSMAAFGTHRPRAAGSRRRGGLAAEPSQRPTEGLQKKASVPIEHPDKVPNGYSHTDKIDISQVHSHGNQGALENRRKKGGLRSHRVALQAAAHL